MSGKDFLNRCVLRRRRNVANDSADVMSSGRSAGDWVVNKSDNNVEQLDSQSVVLLTRKLCYRKDDRAMRAI